MRNSAGEEPAHDFLSLRAGGSSPFQRRLHSSQQGTVASLDSLRLVFQLPFFFPGRLRCISVEPPVHCLFVSVFTSPLLHVSMLALKTKLSGRCSCSRDLLRLLVNFFLIFYSI
jgi:hypothetical protein